MVELADTHDSGSCASRHGGSSPPFGTKRWVSKRRAVGIATVFVENIESIVDKGIRKALNVIKRGVS